VKPRKAKLAPTDGCRVEFVRYPVEVHVTKDRNVAVVVQPDQKELQDFLEHGDDELEQAWKDLNEADEELKDLREARDTLENLEQEHIALLADRELLLDKLGLTQHEWSFQGGAVFYGIGGTYVPWESVIEAKRKEKRDKKRRQVQEEKRMATLKRRHDIDLKSAYVPGLKKLEPQQANAVRAAYGTGRWPIR